MVSSRDDVGSGLCFGVGAILASLPNVLIVDERLPHIPGEKGHLGDGPRGSIYYQPISKLLFYGSLAVCPYEISNHLHHCRSYAGHFSHGPTSRAFRKGLPEYRGTDVPSWCGG